MKSFFITALLLSPLLNFAQYEIKGTAAANENGKKVYLKKVVQNEFVVVDSAQIVQQKFYFNGGKTDTQLAFIQFSTAQGSKLNQPFILENGSIQANITSQTVEVSGTKNNANLKEFSEKTATLTKEIQEFQKNNQEAFQKASQANDQKTIEELMTRLKDLQSIYIQQNLDYVNKNKDSYVSLLILTQLKQSIDEEQFVTSFQSLSDVVKLSNLGKEVSAQLQKTSALQIGKKAPNFKAKNPEGKEISLYENLGKVTLVDFWASWCGPCRQENPNVVKLYHTYKGKGLQIIGVSLDKDEQNWKKAIEKDQLTWLHLSNLKFWNDPIAELYQVSSIPQTYLLDENGIIIAKNLRGAALEQKVAQLLK